MRSVREIKKIKGKIVLLRVDFNVPLSSEGEVEDDFRIKKALPTINFLQKRGARVVLITHLGSGGQTLAGVARALNKHVKAKFVEDIIGGNAIKEIKTMKSGEIILLENLRSHPGEKGNDKIFAAELAKLADAYVNEAFPVDHRADASIVLLPKLLRSYAGLQLSDEINNLSRAFKKAAHPFVFILGGAKFSTKVPLIKKYLRLADFVFIGGALANDFFKARGYEVGKSLVDRGDYGIEKFISHKKLILPADVLVEDGGKMVNKNISEVRKEESIIDIGTQTADRLALLVKKSKFILWNGPLGKYEDGGDKGTKKILKEVLASQAQVIIGGGDIVSVLSSLEPGTYNLKSNLFVSTGGGATLEFLSKGTLPGIKALR